MADAVPEPAGNDRGGRRGAIALCFAVAAAVSCWNVMAAPFGLVVGIASVWLSIRALRGASARRIPALALAVAVAASLASGWVVAVTAGAVGTDLPGEPVVKGRTQAELDELLSQAAERTRARRERASHELEAMAAEERDGGTARSTPGRRDGGSGAGSAGRP